MIKKLTLAAFVGAQLAPIQPATAADFTASEPERVGAFGGLRVRVPLGADEGERRIRAGFAIAPTVQRTNIDGERRLLVGEGVELGYRSGGPLALSVAGFDVRDPRLGAGQDEEEEEDREGGGPSWWLIAGGVVIIGLGLTAIALNRIVECERGCD